MNELEIIDEDDKCLVVRNGLEIWLSPAKAQAVGNDWVDGTKPRIKVEGRFLNSVDIIGIVLKEDIDDMTKRRNGEWKCQFGRWHKKSVDCECIKLENPWA